MVPWTLLGGLSGPVRCVSGPRGGLDGIVLSLNVSSFRSCHHMIGNLQVSRHSIGNTEGNITRNGSNDDNNSSSKAISNMLY